MSLDFDLRAIQNRDKSDQGWEVTASVIQHCMTTGIGEITETTWSEWWTRYVYFCRLSGTGDRMYLTVQNVRDHIGLKTNVFPLETRNQWIKRMVTRFMTEYKIAAEQWARKQDEAGEPEFDQTTDLHYLWSSDPDAKGGNAYCNSNLRRYSATKDPVKVTCSICVEAMLNSGILSVGSND